MLIHLTDGVILQYFNIISPNNRENILSYVNLKEDN